MKSLLADSRVNPNLCESDSDFSPLIVAIFKGDLTILEMLLSDVRVNVNCQTFECPTPLIWSMLAKREHCALRLLSVPNIDVDCHYPGLINPLMLGAMLGQNWFLTELLKRHEVDVNE